MKAVGKGVTGKAFIWFVVRERLAGKLYGYSTLAADPLDVGPEDAGQEFVPGLRTGLSVFAFGSVKALGCSPGHAPRTPPFGSLQAAGCVEVRHFHGELVFGTPDRTEAEDQCSRLNAVLEVTES